VLSVRDVLLAFCEHRMEVVLRRSEYRRRKAEARRHILRALIKALDRIDEVIAAIRASRDATEAKAALVDLLGIDDEQAQAIIEMQLRRLTSLETKALKDEVKALNASIKELAEIIRDEDRRRDVVRAEMAAVRETYQALRRRSRVLSADAEELEAEAEALDEALADAEVQVRVLRGGYLEVAPSTQRRKTWRGGDPRHASILDRVVPLSSRVAILTEDGKAWGVSLMDVPEGRRVPLSDVADVPRDAGVVFAWPLADSSADSSREKPLARSLLLVTSDGKAKRLDPDDAAASTRAGVQVCRVAPGERVVAAALTTDSDPVVMVSSDGNAVRVTAGEVPPQGRTASGVKAMRLDGETRLVGAAIAPDEGVLVCGTQAGWIASVTLADVPVHGRGAKGVRIARTDRGHGPVVAATVCERRQTVWLVDEDNKPHSIEAKDFRRGAQGRHVTDTIASVFV
jgi:DNA gyrase subunit A